MLSDVSLAPRGGACLPSPQAPQQAKQQVAPQKHPFPKPPPFFTRQRPVQNFTYAVPSKSAKFSLPDGQGASAYVQDEGTART
jgi:hypothetical protein